MCESVCVVGMCACVWCGYIRAFCLCAGIKLPTKFVTPEEGNGRGGVEFAFMSTTTAKEVAASYIDTDKVQACESER